MIVSDFRDVVLVVVFNYSNCLNNKEAIKKLYAQHFQKIIFYSDLPVVQGHEDVHFISIDKGFTTHAIFPHLWANYRQDLENSAGLFYTMDDCIINTYRLAELDVTKVICNYGSIIPRPDYLSLSGWHWDKPHGTDALKKLFSINSLPEIEKISGAFSDYFYLPRKFIDIRLFELFDIFANAKVFLEIAIPTIIHHVTQGEQNHGYWKEVVLWRDDRLKTRDKEFLITNLAQCHFFHPIKFNEYPDYLPWIQEFFAPKKGKNDRCIIITTINSPNQFVLDYSRISNWDLIVVGDSKTPDDAYSDLDCIYLGLEQQKELFPTLFEKIPLRSYTRKMFGYLYAIQHGYTAIYETDDDNWYRGNLDHFNDGFFLAIKTDYPGNDIRNVPMADFDLAKVRQQLEVLKGVAFTYDIQNERLWVKHSLPGAIRPHKSTISGQFVQSSFCRDRGFVNLYRVFTDERIWPRGIPPTHAKIEEVPDVKMGRIENLSVAVIQGLVDNDPDVDAQFRINGTNEPFSFSKNHGVEVTLDRSAVCPFNTQNTFWLDPELFYALYLPTTVTFRYTDILRGFVALYQLWKADKTIKFTGPSAYKVRNEHDLKQDYESEVPMYQTAEKVIRLLEANQDVGLVDVYRILADEGIVQYSEIEVVEEWMRLVNLYQAEARSALKSLSLPEAIDAHRNSVLQPTAQIAAATQFALQMSVLSSGQGFAISNQDIADLQSIRDGVIGAWTNILDKLIAIAKVRQQNLTRFDGINMLSLGGDCFCRTVLTRWGLKRTAKLGEHSGPFDLAVTYPETVAALLENDFAGFMDSANLAYKETLGNCRNTHFNINFNHELGPDYAANDFSKLRTLYQARVSQLYQFVEDPRPLFLMLYLPVFMLADRSYINIVKGILHNIQGRRTGKASLLVVNSHALGDAMSVDAFIEDAFEWFNLPLPDPGYIWHHPSSYMSDSGIAYERQVIQLVETHLERAGFCV